MVLADATVEIVVLMPHRIKRLELRVRPRSDHGDVTCLDVMREIRKATRIPLREQRLQGGEVLLKPRTRISADRHESDDIVLTLYHQKAMCGGCGQPFRDDNGSPSMYFKTCSRCRNISYCSKQCQRSDWKEAHRNVCTDEEPAWTPLDTSSTQ